MKEEKINKLKNILKDPRSKDPVLAKKQTREFLESINASEELIQAQEMMDRGVSPEEMGYLCGAHLELMEDDLENFKKTLPDGHPIQTLVLEHDEILKFLDELDKIRSTVQKARKYEDLPATTIAALKHVIHHLLAAEKHHQREEEVLFPVAEAKGIYGPPQVMTEEHVELRALKSKLEKLAEEIGKDNFEEIKERFLPGASRLVQQLRDHIFKENNILYPVTMNVIPDSEWAKIKEDADKIGYCCFTPKYDQKEEPAQQVLDLRKLPPFERHDKIFELWDKIMPGESFQIINDHDPKPLQYQFDAEYSGQFEWEYLKQGPADWIVVIKKK